MVLIANIYLYELFHHKPYHFERISTILSTSWNKLSLFLLLKDKELQHQPNLNPHNHSNDQNRRMENSDKTQPNSSRSIFIQVCLFAVAIVALALALFSTILIMKTNELGKINHRLLRPVSVVQNFKLNIDEVEMLCTTKY